MKKIVLLVDDSETACSYHSYILTKAGFLVEMAADGGEALEQVFLNRYDLIVTDINMRNMDGYEFIRRVRSEDAYRDLPIIILSTEGESGDQLKGLEAGANLCLAKPCLPQVLIEHVQMLMTSDRGSETRTIRDESADE